MPGQFLFLKLISMANLPVLLPTTACQVRTIERFEKICFGLVTGHFLVKKKGTTSGLRARGSQSLLWCLHHKVVSSAKLWSLKRSLRDLGITGPSRGAFTLLGPDSIYQISL